MPNETEVTSTLPPRTPPLGGQARKKVFILDDHRFCCEILGQVIESEGAFELIGWEIDPDVAVERISAQKADMVILDLFMPRKSGLEVIQALKRLRWNGQIIVFTGQASDQAIASAFVNGASAFVEKRCSVEELLDAMRAVSKGLNPMSTRISNVIHSLIRAKRALKPLSESDLLILKSFAQHFSPKEVAEATQLSLSAVYKARSRLFRRLGVTTSASLAAHAWKLGICVESDSDPAAVQSQSGGAY